MSISLVAAVLDIDREAERIMADAKHDAEHLVAAAREKAEAAAGEAMAGAAAEAKRIEAHAAEVREKKVKELTASGEVEIGAVRNISEAAYRAGVDCVMDALGAR